MQLRPPLPDKEYFNIGEACRIAQIPPYTLRYWESRFGVLRPVRRESGHRRYTRKDMETILRIKELLQDRKMTVAGARKVLFGRAKAEGAPLPAGTANSAASKALREARDELRKILLQEFR
ncbi:MAG TPA: MerR family transcriptional regulator [Elusimicrobiota bacterium]|nr:MerR family transcriptional regulator [Elusimicrobiota bacterium]